MLCVAYHNILMKHNDSVVRGLCVYCPFRQAGTQWLEQGYRSGDAKLEGCVLKDALEGGASLRQAHLSLPFSPIALEIDTEHPWSSLLSQESDHLAAEPTTLTASGCSLCPHPLPFRLHHQFWFQVRIHVLSSWGFKAPPCEHVLCRFKTGAKSQEESYRIPTGWGWG